MLGRSLRVDHVAEYKVPKEHEKQDEETIRLQNEGCAPQLQLPVEAIKREQSITKEESDRRDTREGTSFDGTFDDGFRLPQRLPIGNSIKTEIKEVKKEKKSKVKKEKKEKKMKKEKKKSKKRDRQSSSSSSSSSDFHSYDDDEERDYKRKRR